MFDTDTRIMPAQMAPILQHAESAVRAIPPAFPLDATVAVNPFLGQTGEDLATAAARLERVAGLRATQTPASYAAMIRDGRIGQDDLIAAWHACPSTEKPANAESLKATIDVLATRDSDPSPLPTVADLAAQATGTDWPSVIEKTVGLWAAGYFDRGQALWTQRPGQSAFAAWRDWAQHDLTPEIAGLSGFGARIADAPDTAEQAILRTVEALGVTEDEAQTVFHRLLMDLGGWSQHARWLLWQAELDEKTDRTLLELLAIRLLWEEALLAHVPEIAEAWATTRATHAEPVVATARHVTLAIAQDAADRAHQRGLIDALQGGATRDARPTLQAAFCIDVRSEVFRRALESLSPEIETIGFAGFFGLPLSHKAFGSDVVETHLPVLLTPTLTATSQGDDTTEHEARISARATRAWGRFRQAAVSSFAFVEAAGPVYAGKLLRDALRLGGTDDTPAPAPRIEGGLTAEAKAETGVAVLSAMSMTKGLGRVVLLLGHGAKVTNNPHESAYHCGACGGQTGEISARVLADLLNDPETRTGMAERGITVPDDTVFVAGLHNTTTDDITLYDDALSRDRQDALGQVRGWLKQAGKAARAERALTLPGATENSIAKRALDWAEVRPEWGLAGCAAFVAAPRRATAATDLGGRAFLHSYDWQDDAGFATLELILTAPVVVASWISLQYYGSTVAPEVFGGGNKLIHNVTGGIGVIEGNCGRLRPGLPMQAVHDGVRDMHAPLRLSVMIEAPRDAILNVLERNPDLRALFDNGWLHLFVLSEGKVAARYLPGLEWQDEAQIATAA